MNFPKTNNAFDWVAAYQKEYPESQWGCDGHMIEWFAAALCQGYEQCKKDMTRCDNLRKLNENGLIFDKTMQESYATMIQPIKTATNLGREELHEVGRNGKGVYERYVNFPILLEDGDELKISPTITMTDDSEIFGEGPISLYKIPVTGKCTESVTYTGGHISPGGFVSPFPTLTKYKEEIDKALDKFAEMEPAPTKCTCDLMTVIMVTGCKCGAIQREKEGNDKTN